MGPLALLTWLSVSLSTTAVQRQAEARVQNTATSGALYLDQQLDSLAELVGSFAGRPTVVAAMQQPPGRRDPETLDLHLPDMDGEEVLRDLHADPATAALPVVVISADVLPSHAQRLLAAGATRFLAKPLDVPGFLAVIDELLAAVHH